MKHLLGLVVVLAVLPVHGQEPAKHPNAPLRVGGTFTGGTIELKVEDQSLTLLVVEVGKGQTVYLHTKQRLGDRAVERSKKLLALGQEQTKAVLAGTKGKKGEDLKKALDAIRQEFEEKRKAVDWVVVHGTVLKGAPILSDKRGIVVAGEIHDADPMAKPAPLQPGFATVEGEVQPGQVELRKEETAPFSIKAGNVSVAVAGKRATALPEAKGIFRATGPFRIGDEGKVSIEGETLEPSKK